MTELVQGVLTIVKGLKPRERGQLIEALLESGVLTHDEQDSLVIAERRAGRRRPFEDVERGLRKKGRLP